MKTQDQIIAAILQFRGGSLQIFGDWFGRPHDNWHKPKSVMINNDQLIVAFHDDELLTVHNPIGISASETNFLVRGANRVRWEWFFYGRPKLIENRFFLEYEWTGVEIVGSTNVNWYHHDFKVSVEKHAVRMQ